MANKPDQRNKNLIDADVVIEKTEKIVKGGPVGTNDSATGLKTIVNGLKKLFSGKRK